jgi:hypothetical protein
MMLRRGPWRQYRSRPTVRREPALGRREKAADSRKEILKALADSFDYGTAALTEQTDRTMVEAAADSRFGRSMAPSVNARVVYFVIGHTWDVVGSSVRLQPDDSLVGPVSGFSRPAARQSTIAW